MSGNRLRVQCLLMLAATLGAVCASGEPIKQERMAAWRFALAGTEEAHGNSYVATYARDKTLYMDVYALAKFLVSIESDAQTHGPDAVESVEDFPGGVRARFRIDAVQIETELTPLMLGADPDRWDGAVLYTVRTTPETPIVVRCGGGNFLNKGTPKWRDTPEIGEVGDLVRLDAAAALLQSKAHPLSVALATSGVPSVLPGDHGGQQLVVRMANGAGHILAAFAAKPEDAAALAKSEAVAARAEVTRFYEALLTNRIATPEAALDAAFRSALYTLEYNWVPPYGWNECIQHWLALWHMQHTAGAEWIGQADRARACNITTAEHLLPNGAAPQFFPGGQTHRDFGGSNQFFAWQLRHYWHQTGDLGFVKQVAPALDRVLAETYAESDPDHDGLLAWGQQIGNQEDYVSTPFNGTTPTIEGINMLRTRAEFARALDDPATAEILEKRALSAEARLREQLWVPELGRFAFFRDPMGVARLDGQYHTLLYPGLWDVAGPLDTWTSLRHLRDRLTGAGGEVYCSNNFPNHVGGTWGMQAGAAQQPWAAWAFAAAGLRNETCRPLLAAARWAMDENHRGSWPEICTEPCAAYFSPPAGLFVAAVAEALFGLHVDRPAGALTVAPSFPDAWPSARIAVAEYAAKYAREGNTLKYAVRSKASLARKIRWKLPPARMLRVLVDEQPVGYRLEPGVEGVTLALDIPPANETALLIEFEPAPYTIDAPKSLAEGECLDAHLQGMASVIGVADPCGLLNEFSTTGAAVHAELKTGLLDEYAGYGRLGQMNFARRTFFLRCGIGGGAEFYGGFDIAVLPRFEASGAELAHDGMARFRVHNNTDTPSRGGALLRVARIELPVELDLPPREDAKLQVPIPKNLIALLSPGDNRSELLLPNGGSCSTMLDASGFFAEEATLRDYAAARIECLPLPEQDLVPDTEWRALRTWYAYLHYPWAGAKPPLETVGNQQELRADGLPQVRFQLPGRRFVPVSWRAHHPAYTLDLGGRTCRKLYLLVIPFLDNHDMFAPVARVTIQRQDGGLQSRTLRFPGDLDWWVPKEIVGDFATARQSRADRFALLPQRKAGDSDWIEAAPPAFPQPALWSASRAVLTATAVMNVIEMDLGESADLASITIESIGADPALGLVAVSAEVARNMERLQGTPWMPPAAFREPAPVFDLARPGALDGWTLEGTAFSIAAVPSLFTEPTLNSLAIAGESATGKAVSPAFTVPSGYTRVEFTYHGGHGREGQRLEIQLVDADSGEALQTLPMPSTHVLQRGGFEAKEFAGRSVRLVLLDENPDTSFAWLGLQRVWLSAR